ncbi:expressed unknown protein [Seminavis robusta]|uniref:G-protein coupled receptors family 2 profile 2 domain-containing protein n=1 Tax=Seminavis robusta TaxID=568900 RepID=A0A9N8HKQ6_9STRA|nr:expressed unknown protein [Seminavis robusta]|eukprot:Sro964_g225440.1 n/a (378) ;mRNA; r:13327-14460
MESSSPIGSTLTETQDKILSLLPLFTGSISIVGSGQIIYMVLTSEKKTPYRRILLGLSSCDILSSMHLILQPYLMPSGTAVWAFGNEATCDALGFFQQLASCDIWYNTMLSFYFLLHVTVRYAVLENNFARTYEPWMHLFSLGWPLITASIGAGLGVYNVLGVGHGCWVADYGCNAEGECYSRMIGWIFLGIPSFLFFVAILVNNVIVFCHVRSTLKRSMAYTREFRNPMTASTVDEAGITRTKRQQQEMDPQAKRIRAVATQAFLYVGAFFACGIWTIALRIADAYSDPDGGGYYPLLVVNAIMRPLQGFCNFFIYIRPAYIRAREGFPRETRKWAFQRALHGNSVKPSNVRSTKQTRTMSFDMQADLAASDDGQD